jgi:hypothetical protein
VAPRAGLDDVEKMFALYRDSVVQPVASRYTENALAASSKEINLPYVYRTNADIRA